MPTHVQTVECGDHARRILVGQRGIYQVRRCGRLRAQPRRQLARGLRVVADVDHDVHAVTDQQLQPSRQPRRGDALGEGRIRRRRVQRAQRGNRGGGVVALDRCGQWPIRQFEFGADFAPAPTLPIDGFLEEIAAQPQRVGANCVGMPEHAGRRIDLAQHQRLPRARDARLLPADALAIRAQPVDMIDVDGGDHRDIGIHQIHGVQASAQPHFQHCQIQLRLLEQPQRRQRAEFEIGQRHVAARLLDRGECGDQLLVAGLVAVDAHALVVAQQVRRSVRRHPPTGRTADRFDERHRGTLAIGTADGDDPAGRPAQSERVRHRAYALQAHVDGLRMLLLDVGQPVVEGLREGHHVHSWE